MRTKKQVKRDLNHVNHMLKYANLATTKYNKFLNGRWKEDSESIESLLAFYLIQIGDRMTRDHLSGDVREQFNFSRTDFREGIRNMMAHQYGAVQSEDVFEAIENDLPVILTDLRAVKQNLETEMQNIEKESYVNSKKTSKDDDFEIER